MPVEKMSGGGHIITGGSIRVVQMMAQLGALRLEMAGMKRRGESVYSIIKRTYNLSGSHQKVYDQFFQMVKKAKEADLEGQTS